MNIKEIKLDTIKPYHLNCKNHNKKNIEAIKHSITKFKQYKPLIVSKNTFEIIIGNGTFQALKELNYEFAYVLILDLTEQQQKILNILDNKTSDLSTWNEKLLEKYENFDDDLKKILCFDDDFLKKFKKIEKINKDTTKILQTETKISEQQDKILITKPKFIKCPCCNKTFQIS